MITNLRMQVLGLTTAIASIMMMPLDVANRGSSHGGIPMDALWICVYIVIAVLVVLIIPFAYFYYTNYDPEKRRYDFIEYGL